MNKIKITAVILCVTVLIMMCGCNAVQSPSDSPSGKITIVTTIYPPTDFSQKVGGEYVSVHQLLKPGAESHTYEPTPKDILAIENCDLFIYVGGESDSWIDDIISSIDSSNVRTVKMLDAVEALSEEHVEGMEEEEHEEHEEGEELDEHVWTSIRNAELITEKICVELSEIDPQHKNYFRQNTDDYIKKLAELDKAYHETIDSSARKEIIVADRFPFRYMAHEYGLTYYAAFPGCSSDSEPSAKTLGFLINKVSEDGIPVVFHIEFSNEKIADSVVEVSGAKKLMLHSCHNLSQDELNNGEDYLSIMQNNLEGLKEALN